MRFSTCAAVLVTFFFLFTFHPPFFRTEMEIKKILLLLVYTYAVAQQEIENRVYGFVIQQICYSSEKTSPAAPCFERVYGFVALTSC